MKKLLLATLVSAASIGAAQADGPTVYGKINASVDSTKSDLNTKSAVTVDSNASRFGVKGSEKLTDNLSAVYGIEWGVTIDHNTTNNTSTDTYGGSTTDLNQRNRFIGLQYEGLGTVKVGRLDSNLKTVQYVNPAQGVDIFDDYVNGALDFTNTFNGELRNNNVIAFESAKFDLGFGWATANFQVLPSEKTDVNTPAGSVVPTGATGTSSSVLFGNKDVGVYTGLAYDSNAASNPWNAYGSFAKATGSKPAYTNAFRWVGSVDLGKIGVDGVTLNALAQQSKGTNTNLNYTTGAVASSATSPKETAYLVSAIYKFPASVADGLSLKAQWQTATTSDIAIGASDVKIDQYGVDVDYAFSAKTRVYGFVAQRVIKNPNNTIAFGATPAAIATGLDTKYKFTAFGVGIEQKF